jgi:hypothetical protein
VRVEGTDGNHHDAMRRRPSPAVLLVAGALVVGGTASAALVASAPGEVVGRALPAGSAAAPVLPASRTGNAAATPGTRLQRLAAARPLLQAREGAVRSGRRDAWAAALDPTATAFRRRQLDVFDRIRRLPLTTWRYELVDAEDAAPAVRAAGGADAFVVRARLHFRLPGDGRDVVREQYLTVTRRSGRALLADDADPRTERALWDLGDLTVQRARRCLVVGIDRPAGDAAWLREVADEADTAAAQVDDVWGTAGPRTAVVVVPSTRAQLAAALGRADSAGLDQVAAVTSGELVRGDTRREAGAADRVVLNPGPFARLTELGRRVVLTHELTHVVTRATARVAPPLWVEEGFANYVAYRRAQLPADVVAGDALARVRAGTASDRLPEPDDFDPAHGPIAPAYADAWIAFALIARDGAERPAAFYRAAAGLSGPVDLPADRALARAFTDVLRTAAPAFEQEWVRYRRTLAAAASGPSASASGG